MPENILFYSVNTYLKYYINKTFYNDIHHIWCSPIFNARNRMNGSPESLIPPSSNPYTIYKGLEEAVQYQDGHNPKIIEQKDNIKSFTLKKSRRKEITKDEKKHIFSLVDETDFKNWRPLLYLIPCHIISGRLEKVPPEKCASKFSQEYIIKDLKGAEFDVIEF